MRLLYICLFLIAGLTTQLGFGQNAYSIQGITIPEGISLEVGGMDLFDDGRLAVSTRRGEVWTIRDPYLDNPSRQDFVRFARGLHEPLGLAVNQNEIYLTQRGELTHLKDEDGDGKADVYETVVNWPLSGNYHDYSYGPKFLPNGNMLITLNLSWVGRGASLVKWRGWMMQISPEGELVPMATGMRSPAGFNVNAKGDVFYADNQGDWVGSGRITHVESGDFVGHPDGLKWAENTPVKVSRMAITDSLGGLFQAGQNIKGVKAPAVWFPHGIMGISTSDILQDNSEGKFGPFSGQYFVGDQGQSKVMRMFLEKVDGVYQGACFPFMDGFSSGVLRLLWGKDGTMFVGMTNRGWSSTGKAPFGIQRLVWNGQTPFEIKAIRATSDGFELEMTKPVRRKIAENPGSYQVQAFTYKYHHNYGSPIQDASSCPISSAKVSSDGMRISLTMNGRKTGYVHEVKLKGMRSQSGDFLQNDFGYYTLNRIPGGGETTASLTAAQAASESSSTKHITSMPSAWGKPDQVINVGTIPGMKYDVAEIKVKAGSKVQLNFNNNDDMQHNLLIVEPGRADELAQAAIDMGISGPNQSFVPQSDKVLFHTILLEPESAETIYFIAPEKSGTYQFVCTMPGHAVSMKGVFLVNP